MKTKEGDIYMGALPNKPFKTMTLWAAGFSAQ
jgi:hypothetical protein